MRAFDVLTKAEVDIRGVDAAALSPRDGAAAVDPPAQAGAAIGDLIQRPGRAGAAPAARGVGAAGRAPAAARAAPRTAAGARARPDAERDRGDGQGGRSAARAGQRPRRCAGASCGAAREHRPRRRPPRRPGVTDPAAAQGRVPRGGAAGEEVLLRHRDRPGAAHRRRGRPHRLLVRAAAHALRVAARSGARALETIAAQLAGRRMAVRRRARRPPAAATPPSRPSAGRGSAGQSPIARRTADAQQALARSGVQAMLDVFGAEIKDVEER